MKRQNEASVFFPIIICCFLLLPLLACQSDADKLREAAESGDLTTVNTLLQRGVSPDAVAPLAMPPLIAAASNDELAALNRLLDAGADINQRDSHGWTALMAAAYAGHTRVVKALLDRGARLDIRTGSGKTAVDFSNERGDKDTLLLYFDYVDSNTGPGADI
ncbi:MAG: ankyrin repeat domain-containing protein, partial [Bdellovibrionales bacterium]|nr:ankyrin repeat domain-containing protein [Bdellovibrionales bacterium]